MTYIVYRYIFIIASAFCGVSLFLSVFFFVKNQKSSAQNRSDATDVKGNGYTNELHRKDMYPQCDKQRNFRPALSMMNTQELLKDDVYSPYEQSGFCASETEDLSDKRDDCIFSIEYEITFIHTNEIITSNVL